MKALIMDPPTALGALEHGAPHRSGGQVIFLHGWAITGCGGGPGGGKLSWRAGDAWDCSSEPHPHSQGEMATVPFRGDGRLRGSPEVSVWVLLVPSQEHIQNVVHLSQIHIK